MVSDKDDDIVVTLESHCGSKDSDGPSAAVVQGLESQRLQDLPEDASGWIPYYQAVHMRSSDYVELDHDQLLVTVGGLPPYAEPGTQEALGHLCLHHCTQDPPGEPRTFLSARIPLPIVEGLTGKKGDEAMTAFLATTEYRELKEMLLSNTVHTEAIPDKLPGM